MLTRILLALTLLTAPAQAQNAYEQLFDALAQSQNRAEAGEISAQIWQIWLTAPDPTAQEVLDTAMERRNVQDFLGAIAHLNRLVEGWPDYAEGWNQRATMYYLLGAYDESLQDVEQVLALEPRHFGALSGKAVILFNQGKLPLAQIVVREALQYHPHLNERAMLNIRPGTDL